MFWSRVLSSARLVDHIGHDGRGFQDAVAERDITLGSRSRVSLLRQCGALDKPRTVRSHLSQNTDQSDDAKANCGMCSHDGWKQDA